MKKKLFWIAVGQFIGAVSFSQILNANHLVATGFGGLATVIHQLTGWNVQLMLIAMALPVFIWAYFKYDKKQIFYAAFSFFAFTFYIGFIDKIIPPFHTDPIIAVVAGGVVGGVAGGIVMKQRVANGPEAVVGLYLKEKTGLSIGNYFLVLNTIIIFSSILYGDLTIIVYSLICNFVASVVTDKVIMGIEKYYVVNVMSDEYLRITEFIQKDLHRGVTFIQGMDTANVKKKMLVQTIVTQQEFIALKDFIRAYEDDSIVYATRSTNIIGRGFEVE
jgi:uncharacterized membrane-anchored protein YitT (DUF2179 family)